MNWAKLVEETEREYTQHLDDITLNYYQSQQAILKIVVQNELFFGASDLILKFAGLK